MSTFEIRTKDAVLAAAIADWWENYCEKVADGRYLLTDLDSYPATGEAGEWTFSRKLPADLLRPFSFEELENLFENGEKISGKRLVKREDGFYLEGVLLVLTPLEEKILTILSESSEPCSAGALAMAVWGEERSSNQINVYINYLRKKTDLPGKERLIYTARGKGFYLKND